MICALSGVVQSTNLRPFDVIALAASTLGAVYRDTADAHCGAHGCSCGWEPDRRRDIEGLITALYEAAQRPSALPLPTHHLPGRA